MILFLRAALMLAGLFFGLVGLGFFADPAARAADFGFSADGTLGLAAIRADMTAFFVVAAVWLIYGAWKRNGDALLVPAALFGIALLGRCVSLVVDGRVEASLPPMVVEGIMVVLALTASRVLPHRVAA